MTLSEFFVVKTALFGRFFNITKVFSVSLLVASLYN